MFVLASSPEEAKEIADKNLDVALEHFKNKRYSVGSRKVPAIRKEEKKIKVGGGSAKVTSQQQHGKVLQADGTVGPVNLSGVNETVKKKVSEAVESSYLYNVLRQQKAAGVAALSMKKLDKYMQNQGRGQFNFDVLKAAYDSDPKLQSLIKNFDDEKVEFKQDETDDLPASDADVGGGDKVAAMAKSATDLGDEF